jgi:hypothetical protein
MPHCKQIFAIGDGTYYSNVVLFPICLQNCVTLCVLYQQIATRKNFGISEQLKWLQLESVKNFLINGPVH